MLKKKKEFKNYNSYLHEKDTQSMGNAYVHK